MDKSEKSLADLYSQALEAMQKAEDTPRGEKRQDLYNKARREFEQAMDLTERLSLFSNNESIDDVSTVDLKYILIPAFLAKITLSSESGPNRLGTFTKALRLQQKFFRRIIEYGLADKDVEQAVITDEIVQTPTSSSLESAAQLRNEKIEKFKKMKLLEGKIEMLQQRLNAGQEVDDEVAREYYLSLIKKWISESLESLEREVKPGLYFERNRTDRHSQSITDKPKVMQPKLPQTMTIVKNEMQKKVFGLGYPSRPTVTVDEFITKKINDGDLAFHAQKEVYANSLQRYAEQPNLAREQEEASDAERDEKEERDDDEELQRKRRWDEFTDENPRGSGNRHNMG